MNLKKVFLITLYLITAIVTVYCLAYGGNYYFNPVTERAHHAQHDSLKPGGIWGHGLGIIGTFLMVLMLLYVPRKYFRFMRNWGSLGIWLDVHIWLGITGPILVLFHTAFKFGGIVSISFWSMMAVAFSGVFGRFIYLQIPRKISGEALSADELQKMDQTLTEQLHDLPTLVEPLVSKIQELVRYSEKPTTSRLAQVRQWMVDSLRLRFQLMVLRRELRSQTKLNSYMISDLIRVIKERRLFARRMQFLKVAHKLLHHWHLVHRPFAIVMYIIAVVHVLVATLLGYTWVL
jgi:hypothetical protein